MTSALPIGVLSLVLSFLIGVLGGFPIQAASASDPTQTEAQAEGSSKELAEMLGNVFLSKYSAVLDGLMEHQENPDYARAEAERAKLLGYGESLIPRFNELAQGLSEQLAEIAPEDPLQ